MPDYFISNDGSDSTGDGSWNNPWRTVRAAIDTGNPKVALPASGPTRLILEPGVYRESATMRVEPSAAAPLEIVGDFDGSLFGAAGKANPKKGVVEWRAWSDPWTSLGACLSVSNKSHVTISRIKFVGGVATISAINAGRTDHLTVSDCVFVTSRFGSARGLFFLADAGQPLNATIRRCAFLTVAPDPSLAINAAEHAAEYDLNVLIESCLFVGGSNQINIDRQGGSGGAMPTGVTVRHCGFYLGATALNVYVAGGLPATTAPVVTVRDSAITARHGFQAGHASHIDEDGNLIHAQTPRSNVSAGPNSRVDFEPALEFLDALVGGNPLRPPFEPSVDSALLGFGAFGPVPALDLLGREYAEPPAAGPLERVEPEEPEPDPGGDGPTYIFQTEG